MPERDYLLPPSLREWLPADHLAYFVSDLVDQLDLSGIAAPYEEEERGFPPYHPVMLTKVLLYASCVGVFSSRRIQRRLAEDVAFRVLAADNQPDFRTIAAIAKRIQQWALGVRALPGSGLRGAIEYMGGMWENGLLRFLDDPNVPIDNNGTERCLRGVVTGRKNHYGSRSPRGTESLRSFTRCSRVRSSRASGRIRTCVRRRSLRYAASLRSAEVADH